MATTPYERQADFVSYQTTHPGEPPSGADLDNEFNAIERALENLRSNLNLLQRDDGALSSNAVHVDSLSPDVKLLLTTSTLVPKGLWTAGTTYVVGDLVELDSVSYACVIAHTSVTFVDDRTAGRWMVIAGSDFSLLGYVEDMGYITEQQSISLDYGFLGG
jgi:hypothetical protein